MIPKQFQKNTNTLILYIEHLKHLYKYIYIYNCQLFFWSQYNRHLIFGSLGTKIYIYIYYDKKGGKSIYYKSDQCKIKLQYKWREKNLYIQKKNHLKIIAWTQTQNPLMPIQAHLHTDRPEFEMGIYSFFFFCYSSGSWTLCIIGFGCANKPTSDLLIS